MIEVNKIANAMYQAQQAEWKRLIEALLSSGAFGEDSEKVRLFDQKLSKVIADPSSTTLSQKEKNEFQDILEARFDHSDAEIADMSQFLDYSMSDFLSEEDDW